jgi:ABC-type nitrate/sulfonate/bicarbonate transport system permease component
MSARTGARAPRRPLTGAAAMVGAAGTGASRRNWLLRVVVLVAAVGIWQLWAGSDHSPFFPPPSAIAAQMYQRWFSGPPAHLFLTGDATGNILPSLVRILGGLAIAAVIGIPAGMAIGRSGALSGYLDPLLQFARTLPPVALVTVFIAIFKLGTEMEIAFIAFGTIWPILLNTIDGARSVDPLQVETARVFALPAGQRLTKLIVPATMPRMFAGLRLSLSLAVLLMVFSELVGSSNGIGYEMNNASSSFDLTTLWAGIALVAILGILLNGLLTVMERRVLRWHRGARRIPE